MPQCTFSLEPPRIMVYTYTRITCHFGLDKPINQTTTHQKHTSSAFLCICRFGDWNFSFTATLATKTFRLLPPWRVILKRFFEPCFFHSSTCFLLLACVFLCSGEHTLHNQFFFFFWMMFLLGESFPQFSLLSSHSETCNWIRRFGPDTRAFCFFIQPEEGPSIRDETSYPIASFWVAGEERELWKFFFCRLHCSIVIFFVLFFSVLSFAYFSFVYNFHKQAQWCMSGYM